VARSDSRRESKDQSKRVPMHRVYPVELPLEPVQIADILRRTERKCQAPCLEDRPPNSRVLAIAAEDSATALSQTCSS